jgi:DNA-directed RNA polymerase specialized sigma24 family protein
MKKDWEFSPETFEALLAWLDPDREQAALKYKKIHSGLIKFFIGRGVLAPEDFADETINRVAHKLKHIEKEFSGDPEPYFFRVAAFLCMEYRRRKLPRPMLSSPADPNRIELEYNCLDRCIDRLTKENRDLMLRYYNAEGSAETELRRALAEELGIAPNALRIRAYRIRQTLRECVERCIERAIG